VTAREWGKTAQKIRVPAALLLGAGFLLLMHPSLRSLWIGGIVAAAGAALRIWAAGHIEKGKSLARGGPYAYTRNPLYLGSLVMAVGVMLAGQVYCLLLPLALYYAAVYYPVMKAEEGELAAQYGSAFGDYAARVPLFVPRFTSGAVSSSAFQWSRVLRNGEHRNFAGLLLVEAALIVIKFVR
jgi:protein-S-isoprenylcysteine O-methyltransferase Ste14